MIRTFSAKDRDWYCFECHQAGLVYSCRTCFRSYHEKCIQSLENTLNLENSENFGKADWCCPWCVYRQSKPIDNDVVKDRLNQCFDVILRGTLLVPEQISKLFFLEIENEFQAELELKTGGLMYYKNFVFRDSDLAKIKKTVDRNQIKFVDQLELEMRNLLHNCHCYYGSSHYTTQRKFY